MADVTVFSPAKINLFLAVTGRRADGFHDLVSVVAPLTFGDRLQAATDAGVAPGTCLLECDDPEVPGDETNLVLRAARQFRAATGWTAGVRFRLEKRIPMAAGLGGGSSNGVAALRALNELSGARLGAAPLAAFAAALGADCSLFLSGGPVVMRGRGEQVTPLPEAAGARLRGRRVLLFKPALGVGTEWAYGRLAAAEPAGYLPAEEAERKLADWCGGNAPAEDLLFNSFEAIVFKKFVALPVLVERLRAEFGLKSCLTGSGSACFAFLPPDAPVAAIEARIREAWGPVAFVQATEIAAG